MKQFVGKMKFNLYNDIDKTLVTLNSSLHHSISSFSFEPCTFVASPFEFHLFLTRLGTDKRDSTTIYLLQIQETSFQVHRENNITSTQFLHKPHFRNYKKNKNPKETRLKTILVS